MRVLRFSLGWPLATLLTLLPSLALADTAVLLPPSETAADPSLRADAYEAVRDSLQAANYTVVSSSEAKAKLQTVGCIDMECASSMLTAVGADMLVATAVQPATGDGDAANVTLTLADPEGRHVNASADVEDDDVARAARAALQRALVQWPARVGVLLRVDGSPAGATVSIDGQPAGVLPLEDRVTPGEHRIVVNHHGYQAMTKVISVPATPDSPVVLDVALDAQKSGRSKWFTIGAPTLLSAAGIGLIVAGLAQLPQRGCNQLAPNGGCLLENETAVGPLVAYEIAGAALLAGGITWFIAARGKRSTAVGFSPTGLHLRGQF